MKYYCLTCGRMIQPENVQRATVYSSTGWIHAGSLGGRPHEILESLDTFELPLPRQTELFTDEIQGGDR